MEEGGKPLTVKEDISLRERREGGSHISMHGIMKNGQNDEIEEGET